MAKTRVKKPVIDVPRSVEEADAYIRAISAAQRELALLEAVMNESIDRIKAKHAPEVDRHHASVNLALEGLFIFAEGNRHLLTDGGKRKSAKLASGQIGWRTTPPRVSLKDAESIMERIRTLGLAGKFIRTKQEINKDALLSDPETASSIAGISISQTEEFFVKPDDVDIETVGDTRKLRKKTGV